MAGRLPTYERFRQTRFFGSLDGVRCLSILAVIWYHTGGEAFEAWLPLSGRGHHGVTLFFAISGFLITTLLLREREDRGAISLRKFYARRSLRIFPLYYTVLAIYTALVLVVERDPVARDTFVGNLPAFATYTSNWFVDLDGQRVIFYFAWSLAAEEQFYLVWPFVERYTSRWTPVLVMAFLLLMAYLAATGALGEGLAATIFDSIMPALCLGAILAHLMHEPRTFRWTAMVLGWRFSAPLFLALLVGYNAFRDIDHTVVHALSALAVGACACREDHFLSRPLAVAPIAWVGKISYGMYLLHMLAKNAFDVISRKLGLVESAEAVSLHPAVLSFVGTTAVAVVAASLSFRYYEAYFLRLKARFAAG